MATSQADWTRSPPLPAPAPTGWLDSLTFAKKRQFAWKTVFLAMVTLAMVPILFSKHALAAQIYLGALVLIHVGALAIFVKGVEKRDIAPSRFGLFWRVVGLAVVVALLGLVRLDAASPWFWGGLFGIWALHTGGLAMLHVRAKDGAACPFLPGAWFKKSESEA